MRKVLWIFFILLLSSCIIKEPDLYTTIYQTVNNTNENIVIEHIINNGNTIQDSNFTTTGSHQIDSHSTFESNSVIEGNGFEKRRIDVCCDLSKVIYNDSVFVYHIPYLSQAEDSVSKNLYTAGNWILMVDKPFKRVYRYTFTEADYIEARKLRGY